MDRSEWVPVPRELLSELADDLESMIQAHGVLPRYIERDLGPVRQARALLAAPPPPAEQASGDAWHEAIVEACFRVEGGYHADDPRKTVRAIEEWWYQLGVETTANGILGQQADEAAEQASGDDFVYGVSFIVRNKDALLALTAGPSERHVVEQTIAALSQRPVVGEAERDRDRLDYIEREGISVSCQWKNTGWAGGPKWQAYVYGTGGKVFADGDTLRATIDALAPQQPTGEEE